MNRNQAHLALLKTSLLLTGALSVLVGVSIFNTRPSSGPSLVEGVVKDMVARVPAAIPRLLTKKSAAPVRRLDFEVWKIPCFDHPGTPTTHLTHSRWIRISTQDCNAEITDSKLENKTNGFVATVFIPSSSLMTSDFIPLNIGPNQLSLDVTMVSGATTNLIWTVTRQSAGNSTTASN